MDEKLKNKNVQKRAVFYVYVIFLEQSGQAGSVATAGFFPLDLGFLVSSGFLGIFVSNLGFFI